MAGSTITLLLVIVDDFHIDRSRTFVRPFEANPPLVVDADAVLAFAVSHQCFKPVAGQSGEILQRNGRFEPVKFQARGTLDPGESLDPFTAGKLLSPLVP